MALKITTPIQMRFADVDSFSHVNNIAQQAYLDLGKAEFYKELWRQTGALRRIPAIIVSVQTDFLNQILYGDEISVETSVESIGTKSLTLYQQIMRGDEICTRSRTVMVCFDQQSQLSVEVPEPWRKVLE